MDYGYCRCSTNESRQDIDRQIRELEAKGIASNKLFKTKTELLASL